MVNVYKRLKTDGDSHRLRVGSWEAELSLAISDEHGCNIREMEMPKKKGGILPRPIKQNYNPMLRIVVW
jgi:hypothetical protein